MADRRGAGRTGDARHKDRLGLALALLVVASAVPLASNRPVWWLLWVAVTAGLAIWHVTGHRGPLPIGRGMAAAFGIALAVPVWGLIQSVPLPPGGPPGLPSSPMLSALPMASQMAALRLLGWIVFLMLVLAVLDQPARARRLGWILFLAIGAEALWALVALRLLGDYSPWFEKNLYKGVATGTFVNRNALATFLGFGLVLGVALIAEPADHPRMRQSRPKSWPERLGTGGALALIVMLIMALALVATQSRLGLAATAIGMSATVVFLGLRPTRHDAAAAARPIVRTLLVAAAIPATALIVLLAGGASDRFLFLEGDGVQRLALYRQIIEMIAERPWTGHGLDAFGVAFERFRGPPLLSSSYYDMAHSSYLGLWAELGLIVGSLHPLLLLLAGGILWRRLRGSAGRRGHPAFAAGAMGALSLAAVHGLGDFTLEIPANVFVLLFLLGLGLGERPSEGPRSP